MVVHPNAAEIEQAEETQDMAADETQSHKPRLLIENCDPDRTVSALRDILSAAGEGFDDLAAIVVR